MTYFVYKRYGVLDYMIRRDLGDSFVDKGNLWVRLDIPCDTLEQAQAELELFAKEGAKVVITL